MSTEDNHLSEADSIKEELSSLLEWIKKIENFSLARLKTDTIFTSPHSAVNVLAHELHLLRINSKKKEEKLLFLSDFFESFNSIKDNQTIVKNVFTLLNRYLDNSDATLYARQIDKYVPVEESFTDFLNKPLDQTILPVIFDTPEKEVGIFNHLAAGNPVYEFFHEEDALFLDGAHFMFVHLKGFEFIMCFIRIGSEEFLEFDVEFVQGITEKIHTLINNLGQIQREIRMAAELKTASAVQQALFPKYLPDFENLKFASFFQSASETGGDWYGFMQIQNTLYSLIGDVTGHGTPAALVTATASATCAMIQKLYLLEQKKLSPGEILSHLNHIVRDTGSSQYLMTFFVAAIDIQTGYMTFSNAGHNFPFVIKSGGQVSKLLNSNLRLGDKMDSEFTESALQLQTGDIIFLYTDGLIENENKEGEMWGERRLRNVLAEKGEESLKEFVNIVVKDAYEFYEGQQMADDTTIVAIQWKTPSP
ncbi:MAG: serine/threonine-protein phosphatase [SAR324 cluster bacterium]|nr:serine/threonine-protein phosphatase [SAR324 cluster bacterium]